MWLEQGYTREGGSAMEDATEKLKIQKLASWVSYDS